MCTGAQQIRLFESAVAGHILEEEQSVVRWADQHHSSHYMVQQACFLCPTSPSQVCVTHLAAEDEETPKSS